MDKDECYTRAFLVVEELVSNGVIGKNYPALNLLKLMKRLVVEFEEVYSMDRGEAATPVRILPLRRQLPPVINDEEQVV